MTDQAAAIARLEVQISHLVAMAESRERARDVADAKREAAMVRMAEELDHIKTKLDQSAGGIAVLRWLGLGSLGSALVVCATIYGYLRSTQ